MRALPSNSNLDSVIAFDITPGERDSPVLLHVPHSSTAVPDAVRDGLLLDDADLASELAAMTDADTDVIAEAAAGTARLRPWLFVNRLSRLVVDPERFPDDREEMNALGMGAVYERTSKLGVLRQPTALERQALIDAYFTPYARALADLVRRRLASIGAVSIVDVHSYPALALPYELHGNGPRPDICIGTDLFHTPASLATAAGEAMRAALSDATIEQDSPFSGSYVPDDQYRVNNRVRSVMLECRRDVVASRQPAIASGLAALIDRIEAEHAP